MTSESGRGGPPARSSQIDSAGQRGTLLGPAGEPTSSYDAAGTRILILGAGFGGLSAALALDRRYRGRRDVGVLVIDRNNAQLFTPLLWTVADGRASVTDVMVPIRAFQRGRSFHVLQAEVMRIDLDRREVQTDAGPYPYDILVLAPGSVTALPAIAGLQDHGLGFRTPADALELRNHVIDAVETAHRCDDPTERDAWLTFVVAGGGDTGVELAATIQDYLRVGLLANYPWLADARVRVMLLERMDRVTPMGEAHTSALIREKLEEQDVLVQTGTSVERVTADAVHTSMGEIRTHTMFWAAGITAPPLVRALQVEHAPNGAVIVDNCLRVPEHPEVYVVGDAAWAHDAVTRAPVPPTAQAAEHQGRYLATAIAAALSGGSARPYRFSSRGHLTLLGHHVGIAEVGPITISGMAAWLLWHGYYLSHIPSWRNRVHLASDWALAGITGRDTAKLPLGVAGARPPQPAPSPATPAPSADSAPAASAPAAHTESCTPIEDLFDYREDEVDFMSAESFPASDPPPPG